MSDDTQVPATGALSVDQAVMAMELPKKEPEAPVEAAPVKAGETDSPAEPTAEDTTGAETQTDGEAETEQAPDAEAEQAEQQPALEPPKFWDADAKSRFGKLPREDQEYILKKEDERNAATAKALQQSTERSKAAEAEVSKLSALTAGLDKLLPQAQEAFKGRWENVDWDKVVDTYGAEQALKYRNQMENERAQLQQLEAAKQQTQAIQFQRFVAEESAKLAEVAPDLADPKQGPARKEALGKFLTGLGVPADRIPWMTAVEAALAYDAMQWRNGKQTAEKLVAAKPQPAPAKKAPAKPVGTNAPASPQHARIQALSRKSELSIDEAVELANLKGQAA